MIVYGIDIGITGAIACAVNGELREVLDLPSHVASSTARVKRRVDAAGIAAIVRQWRVQFGPDTEMAVLEALNAMPSQGASSVFSLGHSAGVCEGVLLALGIPVEPVAPTVWKRFYGLSSDKSEAQACASRLHPGHAGSWPLVKHHNRAEAVLLASYGWRAKA